MAWQTTTPTTASKIKDGPSIFLSNWVAMENWTDEEHYGLDSALSGHHRPGECSIIKVDTTANITALGTSAACAIAFDTTLKVFKYNTGITWSNIGGPIVSGTKMLFYQDTAPTGWTLQTTLDGKIVFVTKGSAADGEIGGGAHSSGSWTITGMGGGSAGYQLKIADIPSHRHTVGSGTPQNTSFTTPGISFGVNKASTTASQGGDGAHTHTISNANLTHNGLWRPAAYSCIICAKD